MVIDLVVDGDKTMTYKLESLKNKMVSRSDG